MAPRRVRPLFDELEDRLVPSAVTQFTSVGAGGGGYYGAPSVSPTNPNDFYIATDMGAMYQTTDGGQDWTTLNPFQSQIGGEVSTDGGNSWALSSYDNPPNAVYQSVTDPYNGTVYEAGGYYHDLFQQWNTGDVSGGDGGIYASTNNGQSFTLIHNFGSTATSVALDPSDPTHNTMYVTLVDSDTANPNNPNNPSFYSGLGGVWVTNDLSDSANAKWYQLNQPTVAWGPAAGEAANHHAYTVNVLNNGEILVTFSREDSEVDQAGVFLGKVTWNNGVPTATWTDVTPNDGSSTPDAARTWAMDLTIDPTDPTQ